jgi:hypothetical protein
MDSVSLNAQRKITLHSTAFQHDILMIAMLNSFKSLLMTQSTLLVTVFQKTSLSFQANGKVNGMMLLTI